MSDILDKLEEEAHKFMKKRLKVEENIKNDIQEEIIKTEKDIKNFLESIRYVNINYISYLIQNEISYIVNKHKDNELEILNSAITNSFEVGEKQAERFLILTKEKADPILYDDKEKNEILAALLLFGKSIIETLNDDLMNKLEKDIYSIYITAKNKNGSDINNANRNTENNSTINIELSGKIISQYIDPTFDNIKRRANTISQTETNRALNNGILLRYISAKRSIRELKVKWIEIQDSKLCKYCRAMASNNDGIYNVGDVSPPPLHPNCRCVLVPFLEEWKK